MTRVSAEEVSRSLPVSPSLEFWPVAHTERYPWHLQFVARLSSLYEASSASGSVYVSSKRATHPSDSSRLNNGDTDMSSRGAGSSSLADASPSAIVFRVTNGHSKSSSRVKLSTLVTPSDLDKFHEALQPVMRQHLGACLRKRDKAKERKVDKDLAARKKKDEELGGWTRVAKLGSSECHDGAAKAVVLNHKLTSDYPLYIFRARRGTSPTSKGATACPPTASPGERRSQEGSCCWLVCAFDRSKDGGRWAFWWWPSGKGSAECRWIWCSSRGQWWRRRRAEEEEKGQEVMAKPCFSRRLQYHLSKALSQWSSSRGHGGH